MVKLNITPLGYLALSIFVVLTAFSGVFVEPLFGELSNVVDEVLFVLLLACIFLLILGSLKINRQVLICFFFIATLLLLSYVLGWNKSLISISIQCIITFKFFLFFYAFNSLKSNKFCLYLFVLLVSVSIMGLVIELLLPNMFDGSTKERFIGGLTRVGGFQNSPNGLATLLVLYYIFVLFNVINLPSIVKEFRFFVLLILAIAVLLTGSRTALLVLLSSHVVKIFFELEGKLSKILMITGFGLVFGIALTFFTQSFLISSISTNLSDVSADSGYIRGMMIYHGLNLSIENFPFGTGAATYGTSLATGSKVYEYIGISNTSFVVEGHGIYDSNLASLLGEFGFIGLFMCLFLSFKVLHLCYKKTEDTGFVVCLGLFLLLLFVTTPLFMNSYFSLVFGVALSSIPQVYNRNIN